MPEFVACPACGCKVQVLESMVGQRVRCIGCSQRFVATPHTEPPPRERPAPPPRPAPRRSRGGGPPPEREPDPSCPRCNKPVRWDEPACPYCGEEFEEEYAFDRWPRWRPALRRDCVPHRGPLIANLGTASLIIGGLSICTCGLGAVLSLPLGITAWVLASQDLAQMRGGQMDSRGRSQTEAGRVSAMTGVLLSVVFAAGFALLWLGKIL